MIAARLVKTQPAAINMVMPKKDSRRDPLLLPKPSVPPSVSEPAESCLAPLPLLNQRLDILSKAFLKPSQPAPSAKIIALKAVSQASSNFMAQFLTHHITKDLAYPVRVFSQLSQPPAGQPSYGQYLHHIRSWQSVCNFAFSVPPSQRRGTDAASAPRTPCLPSTPPDSAFYVNIVPLSPLAITIEAARQNFVDTRSSAEIWQWLSGYWQGTTKPDIIVEVNHQQEGLQDEDVLCVAEKAVKGIFIVTAKGKQVELTLRQLRRIAFEITEWLRED